jgi:hypothetical protein
MAISPERSRYRSTLNNDGSPLQICVGLSGAGVPPAIRLIGDPAAADAGGPERIRSVQGALRNLLASHGPEIEPPCRSLLDGMLPAAAAERTALGNGGAWLAGDLRGRGLALYATAKWGDPDQRWQRVRRSLDMILQDAAIARETLARLSPHASPLSLGIEGATLRDARVKLYWRFDRAIKFDRLGIGLLARPEMSAFLANAIGDRRIPLAAIVASTSFGLESGDLSDVKLDLCAHCVRRSWPDWIEVLRQCSARHGLAEFPSADRTQQEAEMAFVGFGLDSRRAPRLNVYLKQRTREGSLR